MRKGDGFGILPAGERTWQVVRKDKFGQAKPLGDEERIGQRHQRALASEKLGHRPCEVLGSGRVSDVKLKAGVSAATSVSRSWRAAASFEGFKGCPASARRA